MTDYITIAYCPKPIVGFGPESTVQGIEIPFDDYWSFGIDDAGVRRRALLAHARGEALAKMLQLKPNKADRYDLIFGDYTATGLYLCIKRCMEDGYDDLVEQAPGLGLRG